VARVVVTAPLPPELRHVLAESLDGVAEIAYVADGAAATPADAVVGWLGGDEADGLGALQPGTLVQLLSAGVEHVPFERLPAEVLVAANAGGYADAMAEHVLAMALALMKRLPQNHAAMRRGEFDDETPNATLRGSVVGVLGWGGIGQASARLFQALGARIEPYRRGDDLDAVLASADVLVISLPLTRATRGLIGARELGLMKPAAILVNVGRGAIVDEDALYAHLRANPAFSAGIDTWWDEPPAGEPFAPRLPFLDLPNVLGSPHNSGTTAESLADATRRAAENVARHLRGEPPQHVIDRSEYGG
jgi:phosphoglycerate dehydrogenase-like enzyme